MTITTAITKIMKTKISITIEIMEIKITHEITTIIPIKITPETTTITAISTIPQTTAITLIFAVLKEST
jgi:hypothetical protein